MNARAPVRAYFDATRYREEAAALDLLSGRSGAEIFGIDLTAPGEGIDALVAARRRGTTTALLPILADPYEATLAKVLQATASADPEQRASQLAALRADRLLVNGKRVSEFASYTKAQVDAASLALRLADVVLLGTYGERDRWRAVLGRPVQRFALLPAPLWPAPAVLREGAITLYAPGTPAAELAFYAAMLERRYGEVRILCADDPGELPETRLVVAPEWRALRARALASRGHTTIAPNALRVEECDGRILGFAPNDFASLFAAIDAGLATPPIALRPPHAAPAALAAETIAAQAASHVDGPPVSVIIRTFDRPELLRRAVASVASQTYRSVEIVVVNNGGPDVRAIVESAASGRPYRYRTLSQRAHIGAASNAGARTATGAYVGYLDDDDLLYADHCARAVEVLERSGADIVFTTCLAEYAETNGGDKRVIGYQLYIDRDFDADGIYVNNVSPIHTIVHSRSLFERYGFFDESLPVTDDWELWLRVASQGGRFVRIDRVTCEYSWRYDPQRGNMTVEHQWDFVRSYRTIVQRYAAHTAHRPGIARAQADALAEQERRAAAASDPARRASVVIASMGGAIVPVSVAQPAGA